MSTAPQSLKTATGKSHTFEQLHSSSPYFKELEKHLSPLNSVRSLESERRTCEVLLSLSDEVLGYIIYDQNLDKKSLRALDGGSLDPENKYLKVLSNRILRVALEKGAIRVIADIDRRSAWYRHLLVEKNFKQENKSNQISLSLQGPTPKRRTTSEVPIPKRRGI